MLLLLVVLLLIAILSCPYWWAAILKCGMLRRLTRLARSSGYRVRKRNPWIAFSRNRSSSYDLLIGKAGKIYAVKLWSAYHRRRTLLLRETGKISERWESYPPLRVRKKEAPRVMESRPRPAPRTKLPASLKKKAGVERLLLIYPSYSEIRILREGKETRLFGGDVIFGKRITSPTALSALLTAEENHTD